jgi:hypothetical protein
MQPLAAYGGTETGLPNRPPVRFAFLYMPNGVNVDAWTVKGTGKDFELSETLAPLASLKSEILVFSHLMNKQSIGGDGHYVKVAPFLTGTHVTKTTGSDLRIGAVSMDQLIAQRIGNLTRLPSLELSIEPVTMGVDMAVGYTRLYGSHVSWSSPTTPMAREINPQLAFDRLFRSKTSQSPEESKNDGSVLDMVMDDARRLQSRIGKADRMKLEEYFGAVRSVEKRIAFDAARREGEYKDDPATRKAIEQLGGRIKDYYQDPARLTERGVDHTEHVRLMMDIMVLAFWTDSTRVATFLYGNEVSNKNYSFLEGVRGGFHQMSHHEKRPEKLEQYKRINIWHIQQYAYMLEKMAAIREGDSTLLDNSMIMFGSGLKDGNSHSPVNLPIVLAGRAGGRLATGRHLVYEERTPMCNLYVGMLDRMGTPVEQFGDSTQELPGLSDPDFKGVGPQA